MPPHIDAFTAYELKPGINAFKIDCNFYYQQREAQELKHIYEMLKRAEAKGIGVETEAIKLKHQAEKVEQIAKENSRLK